MMKCWVANIQDSLRNPERFERYLQEQCFAGWQFDNVCVCVSGRMMVMSDVAQNGTLHIDSMTSRLLSILVISCEYKSI